MNRILKVNTPADYCAYLGVPAPHPLVSVIRYDPALPTRSSLNYYGVYAIFLRDDDTVSLQYGCGRYDYGASTLLCVAPGQIGGREDDGEPIAISGWALLFHPDILHGTCLERLIREYPFFEYHSNEGLHMFPDEHDEVVALLRSIQAETERKPDAAQRDILVGYIDVILSLCKRFYGRQTTDPQPQSGDILARFRDALSSYYAKGLHMQLGIPSIQYIAHSLCMSPNYLGDIIKRATGQTAGGMIRDFIVQRAKNALAAGHTIAEVAYDLGMEYPQHFSRMFKKHTGQTPTQYLSGKK